MAAYIVVEVEVQDRERYETYKQLVPPSMAAYGGRFLVRGGAVATLEGEVGGCKDLFRRLLIVKKLLAYTPHPQNEG